MQLSFETTPNRPPNTNHASALLDLCFSLKDFPYSKFQAAFKLWHIHWDTKLSIQKTSSTLCSIKLEDRLEPARSSSETALMTRLSGLCGVVLPTSAFDRSKWKIVVAARFFLFFLLDLSVLLERVPPRGFYSQMSCPWLCGHPVWQIIVYDNWFFS